MDRLPTPVKQATALSEQGFRIMPLTSKSGTKVSGFGADNPTFTCGPEWFGDAGTLIGLLCGPCPALQEDWLLGIDLDGDFESCPAITNFLVQLPTTLTSHEGRHRFFRVSPSPERDRLRQWNNVLGTTGAALDLRWAGGYTCERWDWEPGTDTEDLAGHISHLPSEALRLLLEYGAPAPATAAATLDSDRGDEYLRAHGYEPEDVFAATVEWLETKAPLAQPGTGHDTLMVVFGAVMVGWGWDDETAFTLVRDVWNTRCETPWNDSELEPQFEHKISEINVKGSESFQELELAAVWRNTKLGASVLAEMWPDEPPQAAEVTAEPPPIPKPSALKTVSAAELAAPLPDVPWLVKRLSLAPGRPSLVVGRAGSGKTLLVQATALCVASGRPLFGQFDVRRGPVLHIDLDQGRYATARRYQQLAAGMGLDLAQLPIECAFFNFRLAQNAGGVAIVDRTAVAALASASRGKALVIIDSLRGVSAPFDENSSDVGEVLAALAEVTDYLEHDPKLPPDAPRPPPPTFVVLHHSGKSDSAAGGRGSTAIDDRAGAKWVGSRVDDTDTVSWTQEKTSEFAWGRDKGFITRLVQGPPDAAGAPESVIVELVPEATAADDAAAERIAFDTGMRNALRIVEQKPGISTRALRTQLGVRTELAVKVLDALLNGDPACLGEQLWNYGDSKGALLFSKSAEELVLASLADGPKLEVQLAKDTNLRPKTVKDVCQCLRAEGKIGMTGAVLGDAAWELSP